MQPDKAQNPPTAQTADNDQVEKADGDWMIRARSAFNSSTTYIDNNLRKSWDDSIRSFNSQHANDSKYNNAAYDKRSKLYRPKMRSIIRKNEAAAAAAFFSNMEVVSVAPSDQGNKEEVVSAAVMKSLIEYRLSKSIPWYQIVLGGLQDAQSVGAVAAHVYWDYEPAKKQQAEEAEPVGDEEHPEQDSLPENSMVVMDGRLMDSVKSKPVNVKVEAKKRKPIADKPCIELIPIENLRIDSSAKWYDPIGTSPFVIELIPMYAMDVKAKMRKGEWRVLGDGVLRSAGDTKSDSTRSARQKDRDDQYSSSGKDLMDYEIVWIQRHIHRKDGEDWEFYTCGDQAILNTPHLLIETVFTGERPYVMGCCVLETHKLYPSSVPMLGLLNWQTQCRHLLKYLIYRTAGNNLR